MVIAHRTARQVRDIVLAYMSQEEAEKMLEELLGVEGNKSFRDSIKLLSEMVLGTED